MDIRSPFCKIFESIFSMLLPLDPGSVLLAMKGLIAKFINAIVVVNKQPTSFTLRSVDEPFKRE